MTKLNLLGQEARKHKQKKRGKKKKKRKEERRGNLKRCLSVLVIFTEIMHDHTLKTFRFQNEDHFENEIS